ncbi:hypothetical protein AMTRI_Chr05g59990 [Amborella trichopoda]
MLSRTLTWYQSKRNPSAPSVVLRKRKPPAPSAVRRKRKPLAPSVVWLKRKPPVSRVVSCRAAQTKTSGPKCRVAQTKTSGPKCRAAQKKTFDPSAAQKKTSRQENLRPQCRTKENLQARKPLAPVPYKRKHSLESTYLASWAPHFKLCTNLKGSIEDRPRQIAWSSWLLVISLILFSFISKIYCDCPLHIKARICISFYLKIVKM